MTVSDTPLLQLQNLQIALPSIQGMVTAVRGLDLSLHAGQTMGIVGESGSGKSLTALAIMGLLPDSAQIQGSLRWHGQELLGLSERQWCQLRGNRMAMVFQEPMTALNPVHTVGRQVSEPLRLHRRLSTRQAAQEAEALLERVGIAQARQRMSDFPHQFSGGQRQRIMIAMALACGPDLLIADEPTTALDASLQRQILELIHDLVQERGMALLLISHDLGLVAEFVQKTVVLYGGSVMEHASTPALFAQPAHPYTQGLFAARPRWGADAQRLRHLPTISGSVPELHRMPAGCPFAGRCPHTQPVCWSERPALRAVPHPSGQSGEDHAAACHFVPLPPDVGEVRPDPVP